MFEKLFTKISSTFMIIMKETKKKKKKKERKVWNKLHYVMNKTWQRNNIIKNIVFFFFY